MAGVTDSGFEAKRLADILADASAALALITDPATGSTLQPDFGSEDPAMQVVQVPLDGLGLTWEAMQLTFQQFDPDKANGPSLRGLVQLNGLTEQPATRSIVGLTLGGTPGTMIPSGQLVADINNQHQWETLTPVTLDGGGVGTCNGRCVEYGPIDAGIGTLTNIVTPWPGWASVTNAALPSLGRNVETTTELRVRRNRSTMAPSASPVESVYSNLANLPGVTYTRVYQNNTLLTDANGITAKCVAAVIVGGDDTDIAYTLLARTGVVADWFGSSSMTLFDVQNEPYTVKWTRPTALPIYLAITIQVYQPSVFPANGIQQIKDAIKAYAIGGAPALGIVDGFGDTGFPPGAPVIRSRLYTPLNFVPGHRVTILNLGTAPAPVGTADIAVPWNQYAQFTDANISITVAP